MILGIVQKLRRTWGTQWYRLQRISGIASIALLTVNLAVAAYPLIQWRGLSAYAAIPLMAIIIFLSVLLAANAYVLVLELHRAEHGANAAHNPYQVYAFTPYEETLWRTMQLPMLEAIAAQSNGQEKQQLEDAITRFKAWLDKGYIPKDEYPDHLLRYYTTRLQERV